MYVPNHRRTRGYPSHSGFQEVDRHEVSCSVYVKSFFVFFPLPDTLPLPSFNCSSVTLKSYKCQGGYDPRSLASSSSSEGWFNTIWTAWPAYITSTNFVCTTVGDLNNRLMEIFDITWKLLHESIFSPTSGWHYHIHNLAHFMQSKCQLLLAILYHSPLLNNEIASWCTTKGAS